MFEPFLRLQHECAYNELSRKFPEARISTWCNSGADILEIESDGLETFDGITERASHALKRVLGKDSLKDDHAGKGSVRGARPAPAI